MFRALGLINSLPGLALTNVVASVSFATVILAGYFRTIPQDVIDAARVDGAGRIDVLLRIVIPLARPGIVAVALARGGVHLERLRRRARAAPEAGGRSRPSSP